MHFAIYGAGGLGAYYGARLTEAGHDVWLIARGAHLKAIQDHGLTIHSPVGDVHLPRPTATSDPADIGEVDVVVVAVKTWQVVEILQTMRPLVGNRTLIVPFLNGVEASDQLAAAYGKDRVLGGLSRIFCEIQSPGVIRHLNPGAYVEFGELDGRLTDRVESLCEAFMATGAETKASKNIRAALWEKLLMVGSWAGLGALSRSTLGEICAQPELRGLADRAMDEGIQVGKSQGYPLDKNLKENLWALYQNLPYDSTASLMRDILDGRPSELDAWNGVIVRFGQQTGVPTPVHEFTYHALLPMERRARGEVLNTASRIV